jgi:hypothetical protein
MNSHDVVVRIIQPQEQPQPPKHKGQLELPFKPEKNYFHAALNGLVLSAIALVAVCLGVSYFHLGFSFNDIMVMIGIPMTLGIVTSYAIF